ncbi:MAG: hypothetical protein ACRDP6_16345 [Actinoallomurus sp.]
MRKFVGSSLLVGAAAVGAIALSATSASAAGTWTVSNGGSFTGTSTSIAFKDVTTNQPFNCTSSSAPGSAPNGTGLSGTAIATLSNGTFSGCTGNLGSTGTATLSSGNLNAVSYNAATGVTTGTITGLNATLVIHDLLGTCNAAVSGEVDNVTYNNNGTLTVTADTTPKLVIATATGSGCAGLINANDVTTFAATYSVSPVINITSP